MKRWTWAGAAMRSAALVPALAAAFAVLLAACQKAPPARPSATEPAPRVQPAPAASSATQAPAPATTADYKIAVAEKVVNANREAIFHGAIPPLLPAIVVLEVKLDRDGAIASMRVIRSRNEKASATALAAMRRAQPFPPPGRLMPAHHKTFDFAETFLFVDDSHYQLRTLAPAN